jgi:hypothetical protein
MSDPAAERVERAKTRAAAGWPHGLVSALNILEYGCDEGDYGEEVAAVTQLIEAAQEVVTPSVEDLTFRIERLREALATRLYREQRTTGSSWRQLPEDVRQAFRLAADDEASA